MIPIEPESLQQQVVSLYGAEGAARQAERWSRLMNAYRQGYGEAEARLFSAPGRTEIGGNHTDHNWGKVLAASIDLDSIAVAGASPDGQATVQSEGYDQPFRVSLADLSPIPAEQGTTTALIRGILSRFQQLGYRIGGFRACICSDVPVGSGLSSSASIEVLIATILNALYNDGRADALQVALIAQYAEKVYFGKPCGLMDQITSVTGGVVKIDFGDPDLPLIEKVEFDFSAAGTSLVVVETGGSHANLTGDYAAIPKEMRTVASLFGREVCRQISREELFSRIAELRSAAGDRAILRALHFLDENHRVDRQVESLRRGNIREFLRLIEESGNSSYRWLQNCVAPGVGHEQGIPLALALAEGFLRGCGGACRVHGGGFAGTILAFLPRGELGSFTALMESAFGSGCVRALQVRAQGSLELR